MTRSDEPNIGIVSCDVCLTAMVDAGDDPEGADAQLVCPACGYTAIAV